MKRRVPLLAVLLLVGIVLMPLPARAQFLSVTGGGRYESDDPFGILRGQFGLHADPDNDRPTAAGPALLEFSDEGIDLDVLLPMPEPEPLQIVPLGPSGAVISGVGPVDVQLGGRRSHFDGVPFQITTAAGGPGVGSFQVTFASQGLAALLPANANTGHQGGTWVSPVLRVTAGSIQQFTSVSGEGIAEGPGVTAKFQVHASVTPHGTEGEFSLDLLSLRQGPPSGLAPGRPTEYLVGMISQLRIGIKGTFSVSGVGRGLLKIADDEAPISQDRVFFQFNFCSGGPGVGALQGTLAWPNLDGLFGDQILRNGQYDSPVLRVIAGEIQ